MELSFSPIRSDAPLRLERQGDVLVVNGIAHDFTPLPDGGILPRAAVAGDWLASDVTRQDGRIRLTVLLPHGPDPGAAQGFPAPLRLDHDGPVALPGQAQAPESPDAD